MYLNSSKSVEGGSNLKQWLLSYVHRVFEHQCSAVVAEGEIVCGVDSANKVKYIQIWLNEYEQVVCYESECSADKWSLCDWMGCDRKSKSRFDHAISQMLMKRVKTVSNLDKVKVTNKQLSLF